MNIVICEDNFNDKTKLERTVTKVLINNKLNSEIVLSTSDPIKILDYAQKNQQITLYFLDIMLQVKTDGLDVAAAIRKTDEISPIVLITNYSDKLSLTYEYRLKILDYIKKYDTENYETKITDCIMIVEQRQRSGYTDCLNIQNYGNSFSIQYKNIYFIDTISGKHKMKIHTNSGLFEFYGKLKDVLNELNPPFLQCHKSVIVNKNKIIGVDKSEKMIILSNGYKCPYSLKFFHPDTIIDKNTDYLL